ncbi:MAG: VOC family protein [Acidobacteriaceae bacterium]
MPSILGGVKIDQVGMVVKDLDHAMESFWRTSGIGPWQVFRNSAPPLRCLYHGQPASYTVRLAMAKAGQVYLELIEYLDGDTVHRDFINSGRSGVEHLGIFVPNLDQALMQYQDVGIQVLQQVDGLGVKGDGRYAYLDTEPVLGTILELIQSSSQPAPPERIYPPTS